MGASSGKRTTSPRTSRASPSPAPDAQRTTDDQLVLAMRRLFLIGTIAWPAFLVADLVSVGVTGDTTHVYWLVMLRAIGEAAAFLCYFTLLAGRVPARGMWVMADGLMIFASCLLALMAIPFGGIASRFHQGVFIVVFLRSTLLPQPWRRGAWTPAATVGIYPATLALASALVPALRAQWHVRADLGLFLHNFVVSAAGSAMGVFAGHLIDAAKRQVTQAQRLGNYRLKARIGSGGVGEVWLARQLTLGRDVALKVLREQSSRSKETIARFSREARACSKLTHPNTIRIHDFGASDDGLLFIAMELLDGMDIDAIVSNNGPMRPARVIYLARQACGSLAEAHAAGILHRDIKPANIFVSKTAQSYDVVKLLDFGMARLDEHDGSTSITRTGVLTGTPAYMSPEICSGDGVVDARSDIYSFGAVLYYMLTGTLLFPNRAFAEMIMMHISKKPDLPSARLGSAIPADLERVVMKCLEKDVGDRYASVDDLARDLAECEDAHGWDNEAARRWWTSGPLSAHVRIA